ncbi:hypothetical protein GFM29_26080 [Rhizobium leguminosarum bv. viciae]|nr:hypothetical protein [Rhizobium leguminosarum bv. viciae]
MIGAARPVSKHGVADCGCHDTPPISCTKRCKRLYRGRTSLSSGYRIGPAKRDRFSEARCVDSNCYNVLCASEKTRGAVGLQSTKSTGIY